MAEVRPFRGLRYRQSDLSDLLCPPYDVISSAGQRQLYERSPFNAVRLEYGETSATDTPADNRYARAAATLREWLQSGALARDESPRFYLYDQQFTHRGQPLTRRSLFARIRLHDWEEGSIRPHEHTLGAPKEDRLQLLRACRVNISPILALYRDATGDVRDTLDEAQRRSSPLAEAQFERESHRLCAIDSESVLHRLEWFFREERIYVIDGHHRYETALTYLKERRSEAPAWSGEEGENFVLLALVAREDPGLVVLPTHRLLKSVALPTDFAARLAPAFQLDDVSKEIAGTDAWPRFEAILADAGRRGVAFAVAGSDGRRLILSARDEEDVAHLLPADKPSSWRSLDAAVLQQLVLAGILGVGEGDDRVEFAHDGAEALGLVESGQHMLAFFLNPTPTERVLDVADAGERMPQKSTYYYPKLPTGLVMNPLD